MRAFISIDIPKDLKEIINDEINKLRKTYSDVKWVDANNIHITLQFLGEINDNKTEKICEYLGEIAEFQKPFEIETCNITGFPSKNKARVICIEINDIKNNFQTLQNKIITKMELLGFMPDRKEFKPHLTLGRAKKSFINLKEEFEFPKKLIEINEINLYQSTLTKDGPIYTKIKLFKL